MKTDRMTTAVDQQDISALARRNGRERQSASAGRRAFKIIRHAQVKAQIIIDCLCATLGGGEVLDSP